MAARACWGFIAGVFEKGGERRVHIDWNVCVYSWDNDLFGLGWENVVRSSNNCTTKTDAVLTGAYLSSGGNHLEVDISP